MPLSVLQFAAGMPNWGGAEIHLLNLSEQLRRRGHDVTVACQPGRYVEARAQAAGFATLPITLTRQHDRRDIPALRRYLRAHPTDVLHTHAPNDFLLPPLAALTAGVPVRIMTRHLPHPLRNRPGAWVYSNILFSRVVTVSESVRQTLIASGMSPGRVETIHHGTDVDAFAATMPPAEDRARLGIPQGAVAVGIVGRVAGEKGHRVLLEAAQILKRVEKEAGSPPGPQFWGRQIAPRPPILGEQIAPRPPILGEQIAPRPPILGEAEMRQRRSEVCFPAPVPPELGARGPLRNLGANIHIAIIGDGPEEQAMKILTDEMNLGDRVTFTGFREDVADAVNALDIVVVPSVWAEPCSAVVQQGMALGKPVIGTLSGGTPEMIVEGETGLLVPVGDAPALAEAIARLAADAPLRARMGAAGRERVGRLFTLSGMTDKIEALYRREYARARGHRALQNAESAAESAIEIAAG